jgi:hypothetical protein
LPTTGFGLAVRLFAAAACVLLVPGALVLRALGWTPALDLLIAGSLAVSLAVVGLGLALVFAFGTSILLVAAVLVIVSAVALPFAVLRGSTAPLLGPERWPLIAVLALSVGYAAVLWQGAGPLRSDGVFHAARVTKLADLHSLNTLYAVDEFKDGGLHPGYLFPLWHAVDALIARLSGVDVVTTTLYLPAILVLLAFVVVYAAGRVVFASPYAGLALVIVYLAHYGFASELYSGGTSRLVNLSWPGDAAFFLVGTATVALAFTFVEERGWRALVPLISAAAVLTAIHLTYTLFVTVVLASFVPARFVLVRAWDDATKRAAIAVGAVMVPFLLFLPIVIPVARGSADVNPSAAMRTQELQHFEGIFTRVGHWVAMSPDAVAHGGPVTAAGLLAIPFAAFASRRIWASLVLGSAVTILAIAIAPPIFTHVSDYLSLSQARRLPLFLPLGFAIVGASTVLSRLRLWGVAVAGAAGILLTVLYAEQLRFEGPGWTAIVALVGGVIALFVGAAVGSRGRDVGVWALAAVVALVLPISVRGLAAGDKGDERGFSVTLTPGLVAAVRADVPTGAVVFSDTRTAYSLAAYAPVYINAAPPGHVAPTKKNRVQARVRDADRFFRGRITDRERSVILGRWGAEWVVVDRTRHFPAGYLRSLQQVYEDGRYALYRIPREPAGA